MKLVNEIFYSLQGEGYHTGTPATFVRFSGCNLHCDFCDTQHQNGHPMTDDEIVREVRSYPARMVVLTGGEPSLWIDTPLIDRLHQAGYYVAIETNGTRPLPPHIDWITCSPKPDLTHPANTTHLVTDRTPGPLPEYIAPIVLSHIDELKVVYQGQDITPYEQIPARHYFLQPCSGQNIPQTIACVMAHPRWRLSLQIHRMVGIH